MSLKTQSWVRLIAALFSRYFCVKFCVGRAILQYFSRHIREPQDNARPKVRTLKKEWILGPE